jgi:DNA-binding NarL/FixJ family response regulator
MTPDPEATPIRVLIVDDHAVVREGLRYVLSRDRDFAVVAEAADASEAIHKVRTEQPDVVILDISMPGASGLDVLGQLRAEAPGARILMLSVHDDEEYVLRSVRAGAQAYLRKDSPPAELRRAIRVLHEGGSFFSEAVAGRLTSALRHERQAQRRQDLVAQLSTREREVLVQIARGATSKEIAQRLGISPRTVESHRDAVGRKLGVRGVAALTRIAIDEGLVNDATLRSSTES